MAKAAELRFAFVVEDLQTTLRLFRDVFGLEVVETFKANRGTGMILEIPAHRRPQLRTPRRRRT